MDFVTEAMLCKVFRPRDGKPMRELGDCIEGSKLACDTGGHFTNYPTWPLPRTNRNVDVWNNSLNYYALADLMLYRLSVTIKHITLCLQTF